MADTYQDRMTTAVADVLEQCDPLSPDDLTTIVDRIMQVRDKQMQYVWATAHDLGNQVAEAEQERDKFAAAIADVAVELSLDGTAMIDAVRLLRWLHAESEWHLREQARELTAWRETYGVDIFYAGGLYPVARRLAELQAKADGMHPLTLATVASGLRNLAREIYDDGDMFEAGYARLTAHASELDAEHRAIVINAIESGTRD